MAKTEKVKLWENRLNVSERKHKDGIKDKIQTWREYYRGNQWNPLHDEEESGTSLYKDEAVDNMVFSNIRTIMPSINFRNPRIFTKPLKKPYPTEGGGMFDTISASVIFEIVLNYYFKELEIKRQVDKCLLDALIGPWGIMQLGYTSITEKVETKNEETREIEINEVIKAEMPFAVRISPMDFLVDSSAKDSHLEDAEWIAFKWVKRLEDVKSNPRYKNTAKLKANFTVTTKYNTTPTTDNDISSGSLEGDDDFKRVEGWDIWYKRERKLITLVKGHNKLLQENPWPIDFDGFPVEILYFNENPDEIFPISDVDIYLVSQDELNRLGAAQLAHVRKVSSRQYVGKEGAFEDNEIANVTAGVDGAIAWTSGNPENTLIPLRDANVSQDLYIAKNQVKQNIREMNGIPAFASGAGQKFDTATEPALIAQSSSVKASERTGMLEDFYRHIVRKLAQILQETMNERSLSLDDAQFTDAQQFAGNKLEKIAVGGNQVLLPWLNVSKEDIKGEYEFTIEVGSTKPFNQETRKRDVQELHGLLQGNPHVDSLESTKHILEVYEVPDPERFLKDPQESQQQQQQAQQQAIQAEQAKDQPKRDVDLEKTKIKSQTTLQAALIKMSTELQKANIQKAGSQQRETREKE